MARASQECRGLARAGSRAGKSWLRMARVGDKVNEEGGKTDEVAIFERTSELICQLS